MIAPEVCAQQGKVLEEAANLSPLPHVRGGLRKRAGEYTNAAKWLVNAHDDEYEDAVIVPVATITAGNRVYLRSSACDVIRVLWQQGVPSLQVHELGGSTFYENQVDATSPVVLIP